MSAAENAEKLASTSIPIELKERELQLLSMMLLCSSADAQAACLANVDFDKLAGMASFKNAHAAKTSAGMLIKKLKSAANLDVASAAAVIPKKRKTPAKKDNGDPSDETALESPSKKQRRRPKKAAVSAAVVEDAPQDDGPDEAEDA